MFQKLIENFLEHFEVWFINFCYDVVAETRNSRNFGCPKNGFQVSKIHFNFFLETFFMCFPWLLNMSKLYLTCFEFNLGPISAYKRSHSIFREKQKLWLWVVSEIHFFEPWRFLIFCQCAGVTERLYALIGPILNSKHVKYTLDMLSNHGKHLKKVSKKKKLNCIFDTWNPFFGHPKFREFLVSATTSQQKLSDQTSKYSKKFSISFWNILWLSIMFYNIRAF